MPTDDEIEAAADAYHNVYGGPGSHDQAITAALEAAEARRRDMKFPGDATQWNINEVWAYARYLEDRLWAARRFSSPDNGKD